MSRYSPERTYVANAYKSEKWKAKVERMSDAQVFAIYKNMKEKERKPESNQIPGQLTLNL